MRIAFSISLPPPTPEQVAYLKDVLASHVAPAIPTTPDHAIPQDHMKMAEGGETR